MIANFKYSILFSFALSSSIATFFANESKAEEGMWLLNQFPRQAVKKNYHFDPDDQWLNKVRLASAKLAGGCSGSFVSDQGLIMTNHHCAHECIEQISNPKKNFIKDGFYAPSLAEERACPEIEIDRLLEIKDVTPVLNAATKGKSGEAFNKALKAQMAELESTCSQGLSEVRCDVVTLFQGGQYHLYKYERYQDVRLVFAPEFKIAFFGGDADNFMFPRYDLDVAFLRVYKNKEPLTNKHYFAWSKKPLAEGDLTFVTGHPGRTNRLATAANLAFRREVRLPDGLMYASEMRGLITEFQRRNEEAHLSTHDLLFGIENYLKANRGRFQALNDKAFINKKNLEEARLKKNLPKQMQAIEKAYEQWRSIYPEWNYLEGRDGYVKLLSIARTIYRSGEELQKPNQKRLREFTDSKLPELQQSVFSEATIYNEASTFLLTQYFIKLREILTPDHKLIQTLFKEKSPESLAADLIKGTKLKDVKERKKLFGNKDAIANSSDPLIKVAALIDSFARPLRDQYDNEIDSVLKANEEAIAQWILKNQRQDTYPDATGTLRLSFGQVRGYKEGVHSIAPFTTLAGTYDRATGYEPFALPDSWLKARSALSPDTSFNVVTTNDIIGGNSGSPLINKDAEVVGLIFDGNIHSLGGDYFFDVEKNRAVAVTQSGMAELLKKIYKADRLIKELNL